MNKTIIACGNCKKRLRIPNSWKTLRVTCPECKYEFFYSYKPFLLKKAFDFVLVLIGGFLSGTLIAYLNHFYDITGFYLNFIIPIGIILYGIAVNALFALFIFILFRNRGINISGKFYLIISGLIAIYSFWSAKYITYSIVPVNVQYVSENHNIKVVEHKKETPSKAFTFAEYIQQSYENTSFNNWGMYGQYPVAIFDIKLGLVPLLVEHIGLFLSLPVFLYLFGSRKTKNKLDQIFYDWGKYFSRK
jgi:predicted nucleic-acid-binding Zn-ribbon protein